MSKFAPKIRHMQKKIAAILFSTRLTSILFLVFAAAMAIGTFLDSGYESAPSNYTRELIYNAWWFEAIMLLFVINFVGNIFRFRLYRKKKRSTVFHSPEKTRHGSLCTDILRRVGGRRQLRMIVIKLKINGEVLI